MGRIETADISYEAFSHQPFYKNLNMRQLRTVPSVHYAVDFATGTGAIIEHLLELDKLETPFIVIGVDLDGEGLQKARAKFTDYTPEQGDDIIRFEKSSVTDTQIPDSSQELVTFFNSIHLIDRPIEAIQEAARILIPGGTLLINTAYEKDYGYPDKEAERQWATLAAIARHKLREKYDTFDPPHNYFKNSVNDYLKWLGEAGFRHSVISREVAEMDRQAVEAISTYREFAKGSFPNIDIDDSIPALIAAIDPAFERMKTDHFQRGWYSFRATKKAV